MLRVAFAIPDILSMNENLSCKHDATAARGPYRDRTGDLLLAKQALSQLS